MMYAFSIPLIDETKKTVNNKLKVCKEALTLAGFKISWFNQIYGM